MLRLLKRVMTRSEDRAKWRKDTVTLNEKQGEVHPRRKDKTPNAPMGGVWRAERHCLATPEDVFPR